ncbi:MAG: ABC transporter ATP-binding protein [Candidatus Aenigmarchaeota archaeon]|nr:ABC transporter ATP-binding protein [Candidatus Aenigmarchaeota archaeon]
MQKNDYIIELKNVGRTYQLDEVEVTALRSITLKVKRGEFLSIVGKSGSGKSTMVNQIGCIDTPTKGDIYLDGENIADMSESELAQVRGRKIGFIFQTFNLMPTLSVYENVSMPLVFQGVSLSETKERIEKVLKLVQLDHRRDHKPGELSGGERQRVAIARALANNPEVILADEPTGNLDSKTGKQIIEFLIELNQKNNVTVIMVTHDDDLAKLADRTVVLFDGLIVDEKINTEKDKNGAIRKLEEAIKIKMEWEEKINNKDNSEVKK